MLINMMYYVTAIIIILFIVYVKINYHFIILSLNFKKEVLYNINIDNNYVDKDNKY